MYIPHLSNVVHRHGDNVEIGLKYIGSVGLASLLVLTLSMQAT